MGVKERIKMKLFLVISLLLISCPLVGISRAHSFLSKYFKKEDVVAGIITAGGMHLYAQLLIKAMDGADSQKTNEKKVHPTYHSKLNSMLRYLSTWGPIVAAEGVILAVKVNHQIANAVLIPGKIGIEKKIYNLNVVPFLLIMCHNAGLVGYALGQVNQK